ncbi:hypothetical protein GJV85_07475 [Sulfurimonas aquatica]|uniref:Type II secretion system protein GspF domain-containing protein n=1 Tax=Sulfurimonas aquatica TaxID=2672570 RepID=A0A975B0M0_9BACT|nr:hypothetical protein [Sulfurimonas aquatica]QSZ41953.1 hypothetical protein GJV85_07475 [Sulfurimonas aquatica]
MAKLTIMTDLQIQILLLLLLSVSVTILFYMLYMEYKRSKHLKYIKKMISHNEESSIALVEAKRKLQSQSFLSRVSVGMLLAGFEFSSYLFLMLFLTFSASIGVLFTWFLQHWSGFVIGLPLGAFIFHTILKAIIEKRKNEFNTALAIAIAVLVKMMQNGIGFEQAMSKSINVSGSKMFKKIFANFFQEKNTIGEEEAFANLNQYVDSKELRIFALAVKIGRASGGRFSATLEKIESTVRYRKKMQEKVDVVTREGSIGSYVVAGIAVFLYFSLNSNFDGRLHEYFMTSEYGRFQILGIALWVVLGLMVNKMITKIHR